MHTKTYDIIIVGSGIVGTTLALTLAKTTSLSIGLLESKPFQNTWSETHYSPRVSAITLASQRIFKFLGIWQKLKKMRVSPFNQIKAWDKTKQTQINFAAEDVSELYLGYVIENNLIQSVLLNELTQYPQIEYVCPITLEGMFLEEGEGVTLTDVQKTHFKAKLAIAADGAHSWLRAKANIQIKHFDYEEEAIVTTIETEKPHSKIARQIFLKDGPLAFLPLSSEKLSSIVWTLPKSKAQELMLLGEHEFKETLTEAFFSELGQVLRIEQRYNFPLYAQESKQYISPCIALLGDAAHVIHPLAGQGVNMGLLDAASLAEVITLSLSKNRDFASFKNLRAYERWRKADNLSLMKGVDLIKNIFASEQKHLSLACSFGLNRVNQIRFIKNLFTCHAIGNRSHLPLIAQ